MTRFRKCSYEIDPDTGAGSIHVMTGKFISSGMMRKLMRLVESLRD